MSIINKILMGIMEKVSIKILRRIEDYVQLDLGYYLKNTFYLIIAQGVLLFCGFASSLVLARILPQETYGQFNYIFSILGVLAISSLPEMKTAIVQAVSNEHDLALIEGTKTRLKWSILGAVAVLSIGTYYYLQGSILLAKCFIISSLLFPIYYASDSFYSLLHGKKYFYTLTKYQSISQIFLTLITIAVVYFARDLLWIIIANLVTTILVNSYFFISTIKKGNLNKREDKGAIAFGKRLTIIDIIKFIRAQYDRIIIGIYLGFSDLAIYSIALFVSDTPKLLLSVIVSLAFPKLSVMDERAAFYETRRRMPQLILCSIIICGIGIVLLPYIIPLVYSQKYLKSVLYSQILMASVIITIPAVILIKAVFPAQKKVKELFKISTSVSILEIILLTLLVPRFRLLGVVIIRVVARTIETLYAWKLMSIRKLRE